jgi:hypothetical protein
MATNTNNEHTMTSTCTPTSTDRLNQISATLTEQLVDKVPNRAYAEFLTPTFKTFEQFDRFCEIAKSFKITSEMLTTNGCAWTATITYDGMTIVVENDGNGGCNRYIGKTYGIFEKFAKAIYPNRWEQVDQLINCIDALTN